MNDSQPVEFDKTAARIIRGLVLRCAELDGHQFKPSDGYACWFPVEVDDRPVTVTVRQIEHGWTEPVFSVDVMPEFVVVRACSDTSTLSDTASPMPLARTATESASASRLPRRWLRRRGAR